MSFKFIADTFSVARDSDHFIQHKTLKNPGTDDQVWLAIEIVGNSKYARATMQKVIETIETVFFDDLERGAYERFEQALKEVNEIIKNIKNKKSPKEDIGPSEKKAESLGQLNAIIAVFSGNELHITQSNAAEAYLIRNNKFSMISEGLSSKSEDLFVNIASGELMPDDKLIFSTARLLRLATHSQIVQLFNDGVAEAVETIRELTINDEELSIGAIAIHAKLIQKPFAKFEDSGGGKYLAGIKEALSKFFSIVGSRIPVGKSNINPKKVLALIGAVALIIIISVSFLMQSKRATAIREEYRSKIAVLHEDINTANTKGYAGDKDTANAILDKVEREARSVLDSNQFRSETLDLLDKAQDARDSINNTDRIKDLAPYVDLAAKRPDINALGILRLNDNFFAYEYNRLYEVVLNQILEPRSIDESEVVIAGTSMEDHGVLVFLTQSGRVIEHDKGDIKFVNTDDQTWKSGVDIDAYGKYIYILSPKDNQIYKYTRLRSKYSAASNYNIDGDIKDALSMAIDGDIYVLKKGGSIVRFNKGKQVQFKINDLAVDISDAEQIFTATELDNLYILDPINKRVVIVAKSSSGIARYYGQVVFEKLDNIKSIYVGKNENILYVLTNKEIYKIDI